MNLRSYVLTFSVVLSVVLSSTSSAHDPTLHGFRLVMFERPFPSPNFRLSNLAGGETELSQFRGKYVMLNFWATWCPPCLAEMPLMEKTYKKFEKRGFVVLAVSSDKAKDKAAVQKFSGEVGLTFPIVLDPDKAVSTTYGARQLPVTFLLDRDGRVIAVAKGAREWDSESAWSVLNELIVSD